MTERNIDHSSIIIVIPGNRDLHKFFQVINEKTFQNTVKLLYFKPYTKSFTDITSINRIFHIIPFVIRERRHLKSIFNRYFTDMQDYDVYFFSRGFSGIRFYLLKKLAKRNRVSFISHYPPRATLIQRQTRKIFLDWAWLGILKLIYGHEITLGELPDTKRIIYFDDSYMDKYVDTLINWEEKGEMLEGFNLSRYKVFDVGDYDVIYFGHRLGPDCISDRDKCENELENIFNVLLEYFPENKIARKYHPRHIDKDTLSIGDVLPDYIPAEFLYSDKVKIYMSPWSLSLTNTSNGTAISLLELLPIINDERRKQLREALINTSHSNIFFPESLDELRSILSTVKRQTKRDS